MHLVDFFMVATVDCTLLELELAAAKGTEPGKCMHLRMYACKTETSVDFSLGHRVSSTIANSGSGMKHPWVQCHDAFGAACVCAWRFVSGIGV